VFYRWQKEFFENGAAAFQQPAKNGALDFHKRGPITSQLIADKKNPVDDHHIFPRAFLNEQNVSGALRDSILNRTYIDRATNQRLSRRAPSDYFGEIRKKHGTKETDELFGTHLLPIGNDSPLLKNEFEGFLAAREKLLMQLIEGKNISLMVDSSACFAFSTPGSTRRK